MKFEITQMNKKVEFPSFTIKLNNSYPYFIVSIKDMVNQEKCIFINSLMHKSFKIYLGEDILSLELDHIIYNFIVVDQIINFINDSQFSGISVYFNFDDDKEMFLLQNLNECTLL